jgi:hypothetical protein
MIANKDSPTELDDQVVDGDQVPPTLQSKAEEWAATPATHQELEHALRGVHRSIWEQTSGAYAAVNRLESKMWRALSLAACLIYGLIIGLALGRSRGGRFS